MSAKAKGNGHASDNAFLARLVQLIQEQIEKDPYERDGKLWCQDPYKRLAPVLDVCEKTLRRRFQANPTVFKLQAVVLDGGRRMAIVRIAEKDEPPSPTEEAKYLAKVWESRTGRPPTRKQFGNLYHFAQACPPGTAKEVFKLVLKEWGVFMGIVKASPDFHTDTPRYYRYPRLTIIRRFVDLAVDLWVQRQQEEATLGVVFQHLQAQYQTNLDDLKQVGAIDSKAG